jgi:hypothetical protein
LSVKYPIFKFVFQKICSKINFLKKFTYKNIKNNPLDGNYRDFKLAKKVNAVALPPVKKWVAIRAAVQNHRAAAPPPDDWGGGVRKRNRGCTRSGGSVFG